jgi:hypothetical protein
MKYGVGANAYVEIICNDDSAIKRCTENQDEHGVPQEPSRGGSGWRDMYYGLLTESDVLEHWTHNAISNGVEDASRLDGWGDLAEGVVTMRVTHTSLDWVDRL